MIQKAMAKQRSGEGGFTLVELLIVIVILGILAAIVVLAIGGLSDTASKAKCNSGAKTVESAEDAYFAQNGTYGANGDLWRASTTRTTCSRANRRTTPSWVQRGRRVQHHGHRQLCRWEDEPEPGYVRHSAVVIGDG